MNDTTTPAPSPLPTKKARSRKQRFISYLFLGFFLSIIIGFLVLYIVVNSYLKSDACRKLASEKTSAWMNVDGEYMPFHWNGSSIYSDGFAGLGNFGVQEIRADQIRADLNLYRLFRRVLEIEQIQIQRLSLKVGSSESSSSEAQSTHSESALGGFLAPTEFVLKEVLIQETDLFWGEKGGVQKVQLTIVPDASGLNLKGSRGQIRHADLPIFEIDQFKARYQQSQLFITDSQLRLSEGGSLVVSGDIDFRETKNFNFLFKPNGISVTPFLPSDWRAKLKGNLIGEAKVIGQMDRVESIEANGTLHLNQGKLEALPILDQIAIFTRTQQFRQLSLQKASAQFVFKNSKLTVSQVLIESEGLLRMEGDFVVEKDIMDGTFQVGVSPSSLRWIPGAQAKVFTEEREGYVWTTMRITGPIDNLKEDLTPRLIQAVGTAVVEGVKETVEDTVKGVKDLFKPLFQ